MLRLFRQLARRTHDTPSGWRLTAPAERLAWLASPRPRGFALRVGCGSGVLRQAHVWRIGRGSGRAWHCSTGAIKRLSGTGMAHETEYKGFRINLRLQHHAWTATIDKRDNTPLLVTMPGGKGCRKQLVETPPQESAINAMRLALDEIDSGHIL